MDFKLGVLRVVPVGTVTGSFTTEDAVCDSETEDGFVERDGEEGVELEASFERALFNLLFFLFLR